VVTIQSINQSNATISNAPQHGKAVTRARRTDALDVLCTQLRRDLFAIAKFLVI